MAVTAGVAMTDNFCRSYRIEKKSCAQLRCAGITYQLLQLINASVCVTAEKLLAVAPLVIIALQAIKCHVNPLFNVSCRG